VVSEVFDLFAMLGATDAQLDFPYVYASAKEGWATRDMAGAHENLAPLFDLIVDHVPEPEPAGRRGEPFKLLVTLLGYDPFLGRVLTGRIESGRIAVGDTVKAIRRTADGGEEIERARLSKLLAFRGLKRVPVEEADAGDLVAIAGFSDATVADTLMDIAVDGAVPAPPIDPPTLAVTVTINDSPLAGRDGDKVQSRVIRARLLRQAEGDVAIRVTETADKDAYEVAGRGELQLGVLVETLRREGFELSVSRPRVLIREQDGQKLEPVEEVVVDVDDEYTGSVIDKMSQRKARMTEMKPTGGGKTRLVFHAPSRGLVGYHSEFMTDTRGTGVMNRLFHAWEPYAGDIAGRGRGALISMETGPAVAYALWNIEERGVLFIDPGEPVYPGMVIGEHARDNDLEVNPIKGKKLTNIRAAGKDEAVRLTPPRRLTLEQAISWIDDDELVEVTPTAIRVRKRWLDPHERKRRARQTEDV
jgi:GTP-binding protein